MIAPKDWEQRARERIEGAIEGLIARRALSQAHRLIELLDALDGDADLEGDLSDFEHDFRGAPLPPKCIDQREITALYGAATR